jgi:hypothetical protein
MFTRSNSIPLAAPYGRQPVQVTPPEPEPGPGKPGPVVPHLTAGPGPQGALLCH